MKKIMMLLLLIIGAREVRGQADPTHDVYGNNKQAVTKNISDFGGFPNDGIDDSKAFDSAARWFNETNGNINYTTQYGILNFDAGEYIVGDQIIDNSPNAVNYALQKYSTQFDNIDGLIIQGVSTSVTKIKIKDGCRFGWFSKTTTDLPCTLANGGIQGASPLIFWLTVNSKNVIIRNMELDGNSSSSIIGAPQEILPGSANDFNIFGGYGVFLYFSQYVTLENLYIHNFQQDGILIHASYNPAVDGKWNVLMSKVSSKWNGRQALSWVDGRDVKVVNSTFAYTRLKDESYTELSPAAGSPGANIDVEPESSYSKTWHGEFDTCDIIGNVWPSPSLIVQLNSDSISFNNCQIKASNSFWAAIGFTNLQHRNFNFKNCDISGNITFYPLQLSLPDSGLTKFQDCNISGNEVNDGISQPLISVFDRVLFDHCSIKQVNQRPLFGIVNKTNDGIGIPNPDFYTTLNNCNISSTYVSDPSAFDIRGRMYALRFTGNTKWTHDITSSSIAGQHLFFQNATLNGSSLYSPMNSFTFPNINIFEGSYFDYLVDPTWDPYAYKRPIIIGETPCEYLNVYIGEDNNVGGSVVRNEARPLYIGEGATITVRNGSYLILSGDIYLAGKIIIKTGGNIMYTEAIGVNGYPAVTAPSIHILSSTSINDHIIFEDPSASANISGVPGPWTSTKFAQPLVAYNTLRSQLMATDEYLKTDVRRTNKNWDDPNLQCEKCALSHSGPGGDALDCKYVPPSSRPANTSTSGINETSDIQIYPNPTNDKLYISTNNTNEPSDIQLLDINGRQLYKTTSKDAEVEISLSKYPQGTYLIRISNVTNSVVKKVVKTN